MRAVVQRVSEASVTVDGAVTGQIGPGLLVLLGIHRTDTDVQAGYLANKIVQLRIFTDTAGKMNLNVKDISGALLIVSQFTLYGETRRGNRPSYSEAAKPEVAVLLYERFVRICGQLGVRVATGQFQAHMKVNLVNDGPVTLICDADAPITP